MGIFIWIYYLDIPNKYNHLGIFIRVYFQLCSAHVVSVCWGLYRGRAPCEGTKVGQATRCVA